MSSTPQSLSAAKKGAATTDNCTREFLTFTLGKEEYGIDILKVQEIRGYNAVTPIVNAPAFIKGVINLRGTIVPIVDMRIKFSVGEVRYDAFTVVIVLKIQSRTVGMVVDSVSDVLNLSDDQVRDPPELGSTFDTRYLMGLGAIDDRMLILVDIERLFTSADMALFDEREEAVEAGATA